MRSAFAVVFSIVWLPATVVIATSSSSGEASASRIAIASSWPGSQSRTIGVGVIFEYRVYLAGARQRRLRAETGRSERAGGTGALERGTPLAALEQADDEAGRERVAGGGAVDGVDGGRGGSGDLSPVLEERGAVGPVGDGHELPGGDDLVLEPVDDQQVGDDVDRPRGRRVEGEERRVPRRSVHDLVRHLELAEHRSASEVGAHVRVRAGHDDDLVLTVVGDEDQRDPRRPGVLDRELDARFAEAGERLVGERIGADRPDHAHTRAETGRRDRLVRPLAAGEAPEARPRDRLAGTGKPFDARDEVEVDRPDDGQLDACSHDRSLSA